MVCDGGHRPTAAGGIFVVEKMATESAFCSLEFMVLMPMEIFSLMLGY